MEQMNILKVGVVEGEGIFHIVAAHWLPTELVQILLSRLVVRLSVVCHARSARCRIAWKVRHLFEYYRILRVVTRRDRRLSETRAQQSSSTIYKRKRKEKKEVNVKHVLKTRGHHLTEQRGGRTLSKTETLFKIEIS